MLLVYGTCVIDFDNICHVEIAATAIVMALIDMSILTHITNIHFVKNRR